MRGEDEKQQDMFSYISSEERVPADHPLRAVREMVDQILKEMSPRFARLYSDVGRPSIAPERLLRALSTFPENKRMTRSKWQPLPTTA